MNTENDDICKLFKLSEKVSKICKLFAEENLQIQFDSTATTACFYPESRILKFPYNMTMLGDDDIMILFLTHEVGHAFWSSVEYTKKAFANNLGDETNIVEDIRIERMIKLKYPGLVAAYQRGYKKLYDQGFFCSPKSHPAMLFKNRLNIYAKCGAITAKNINFTKTESNFYHRCMQAQTEQEVYDLSVELKSMATSSIANLQKFTREEIAEMFDDDVESFIDSVVDESNNDAHYSSDSDGDDDSTEQLQTPSYIGDVVPGIDELSDEEYDELLKEMAAKQDALDIAFEMGKKVDAANVVGATFINYESMPNTKDSYFTCADYAEMLRSRTKETAKEFEDSQIKKTQEYIASLNRSVSFMAKEFEMKKAAARYKNARVSTTGTLDVNRICQYRVTDEVFAKRITIKDDKNHGMVLLLDASGSIMTMFGDMVRQVLLLTEYAKKIGVPFKVLVFGCSIYHRYAQKIANYNSNKSVTWKSSMQGQTQPLGKNIGFFEALSSEQSAKEYLLCADGLLRTKCFSLYDTPTCYAMHMVENIANDFFIKHNTTNKKLFILTDGGPTDVQSITNKIVVTDKLTKKLYRTDESTCYTPISIMGKIFGDRYNIDVTSMVIANNTRNVGQFISYSSDRYTNVIADKSFSKNKFVKSTDSMGLPMFVIKPIASTTNVDLETIDSGTSIAKSTTAFAKAMNKLSISQTMLVALGEQFAV